MLPPGFRTEGTGRTGRELAEADSAPDREIGKLPPVGNTVDIPNARYTNSIGDAQLSGFWTDPDFDLPLSGNYW